MSRRSPWDLDEAGGEFGGCARRSRSRQIGSGSVEELTVTLQPGTYEVWCSVGNHRQRGMGTEITVG